jgi:hypothetical protein
MEEWRSAYLGGGAAGLPSCASRDSIKEILWRSSGYGTVSGRTDAGQG